MFPDILNGIENHLFLDFTLFLTKVYAALCLFKVIIIELKFLRAKNISLPKKLFPDNKLFVVS